MFDLHQEYPYLEEINLGIVRMLPNTFDNKSDLPAVLDCGCGRGALGEAIQKKGYEVWGIESNAEACKTATRRVNHLIPIDLTLQEGIKNSVGRKKFDYIIFSDVLEHLYDPLVILKFYSQFLNTNGKILISLPNVANWETRLRLLLGRFDYQDTGVLDRTHIRFFTFKTACLLASEAGLKVTRLDCDPYLIRAFLPWIKAVLGGRKNQSASIIDSQLYQIYLRWVYPIEYFLASLWKTLFSFRIILVAEKKSLLK